MNLHQSSIAITGATGFLGGFLVRKLLARGAKVVAVVRNPSKASELSALGAEVRRADLGEPEALSAAFHGCDAVISNAAVVSFSEPRKTHATNVEGTKNVFGAIATQGIKRAIAISSASAYRASPFVRTEQSRLRAGGALNPLSAYGSSKAESERLAWQLSREHGVCLTTFRPCGISGPRDPLLMGALAKLGKLPFAPLPVFTEIGVVHAEDVAEAVALALEKPQVACGKAYNLQGVSISLWRMVEAYRRAGGSAPRWLLPVPFPFLLRYDDRLARHDLGWRPRDIDAVCQDALRGV
ncbi:MAG: NAD(P)-dependent oxidoreductase [Myxococcales bacterium]